MSKFVEQKMRDAAGTEHGYVYKRDSGKEYPTDLAYDNKKTGFRVYFVYDNDFGDMSKGGKTAVFESKDEFGNVSVFETPASEDDIQAVIRTVIMY